MKNKNLILASKVFLAVSVMLLGFGCTEVEDESRAASLLIVEEIIGEPGGEGEERGTPLLSDTCDNDLDEPQDPDLCTVFNDNAEIQLSNEFLQVGPGAGFDPSFLNDIIIERYRVDYFRPNGRNTPGVDVPFSIDGALSLRVPVNQTATATILVVRHTAKREPPLAELDIGSSEAVLTANARITLFGRDVAGRTVQATGFLEIHFANYGEGQ
jgi:hypothetical protein